MKIYGKQLEFISWINRDGSGTTCTDGMTDILQEEKFKLHRLSITFDTYIIHGFNSFVVKIKKPNSEQNPERSVATEDDSSNVAGK